MIQPADFMAAIGVAPVVKSAAVEEAKLFMMIASPKAAGLKIFWPKPPNTSLPNTMARIVAMMTA